MTLSEASWCTDVKLYSEGCATKGAAILLFWGGIKKTPYLSHKSKKEDKNPKVIKVTCFKVLKKKKKIIWHIYNELQSSNLHNIPSLQISFIQESATGFMEPAVHKSTTCDAATFTTHFPVPFGPIFQIFLLKFFFNLFSKSGNFLTLRVMVKNWKIFPNVVFGHWTQRKKLQPSKKHRSWKI